jgi:hypothetical protein
MNEQILSLIDGLIEGRNIFLSRTISQIPHPAREGAYSRFLLNELCMLEVVSRVFQHGIRSENRQIILDIPITANFLDAVPVVATPEQINQAVETIEDGSGVCAICQENISGSCARIRQCSHKYHRNCLVTWFAMSVRCPVCRHDIRGNQTSSHTE